MTDHELSPPTKAQCLQTLPFLDAEWEEVE